MNRPSTHVASSDRGRHARVVDRTVGVLDVDAFGVVVGATRASRPACIISGVIIESDEENERLVVVPRASSADDDPRASRSENNKFASMRSLSKNQWPPPFEPDAPSMNYAKLALLAAAYTSACYLAMALAYYVVPGLDLASKLKLDHIGALPETPVFTVGNVRELLKFMNMFGRRCTRTRAPSPPGRAGWICWGVYSSGSSRRSEVGRRGKS